MLACPIPMFSTCCPLLSSASLLSSFTTSPFCLIFPLSSSPAVLLPVALLSQLVWLASPSGAPAFRLLCTGVSVGGCAPSSRGTVLLLDVLFLLLVAAGLRRAATSPGSSNSANAALSLSEILNCSLRILAAAVSLGFSSEAIFFLMILRIFGLLSPHSFQVA